MDRREFLEKAGALAIAVPALVVLKPKLEPLRKNYNSDTALMGSTSSSSSSCSCSSFTWEGIEHLKPEPCDRGKCIMYKARMTGEKAGEYRNKMVLEAIRERA
jgi:hypothetical protein